MNGPTCTRSSLICFRPGPRRRWRSSPPPWTRLTSSQPPPSATSSPPAPPTSAAAPSPAEVARAPARASARDVRQLERLCAAGEAQRARELYERLAAAHPLLIEELSAQRL